MNRNSITSIGHSSKTLMLKIRSVWVCRATFKQWICKRGGDENSLEIELVRSLGRLYQHFISTPRLIENWFIKLRWPTQFGIIKFSWLSWGTSNISIMTTSERQGSDLTLSWRLPNYKLTFCRLHIRPPTVSSETDQNVHNGWASEGCHKSYQR